MKYVQQFLIILFVSLLGEVLHFLIPLPCPASIYGMIIMFICLTAGIIKLEHVRDTGRFLIEIMPVMFIPAGVGLMVSWKTLQPVIVPISVIMLVSLVVVMGVSGRVAQTVIRHDKKNAINKMK